MDILGRKWALLIINAIGNSSEARFSELEEQLKIVSPKTLSDTLKQLQREGLVNRKYHSEIPPRVEYSLTQDGKGLWEAIIPILKWTTARGSINGRTCSPTKCKLKRYKKLKNSD
ncbi:MAG: helix-turn-helix domain-containing protein [Candidatus Bathyarchaeia archaeon]|nr:helix-turn-helix transcriptional regulator [Candidatus Bathyarchaeota archaeon]NLD65222.1 helix-turn-helix transcriptional regulator [Thermoproteota archaeon]